MDSFIFGYGTLIPTYWRENRLVGEIEGFKRIFHTSPLFGFWYPFVIKKTNQKCRGILIQDKTGALLSRIDEYENYPDLYDRIQVPVKMISDPDNLFQGETIKEIKAWIYIPSIKTSSLTLDRIYKQMKKNDMGAYKDMMEKDLYLEKIRQEYPDLVRELPSLFENGIKNSPNV
jgi:hypothetical protein